MWCKTRNTSEGTGWLALSYIFYKKYITSKFEIECTKKHVFFTYLCLGFHPAWFCSLRTEGGGSLLNGQNLLSVTKAVCWQSLKEKIAQTLTEIKNK